MAATSADRQLKALYNGYANWDAKESGYFLDEQGETKPLEYLPHVDPTTQQRHGAYLKDLLDRLNVIPAAQLSPGEQVNAAIFRTVPSRTN